MQSHNSLVTFPEKHFCTESDKNIVPQDVLSFRCDNLGAVRIEGGTRVLPSVGKSIGCSFFRNFVNGAALSVYMEKECRYTLHNP